MRACDRAGVAAYTHTHTHIQTQYACIKFYVWQFTGCQMGLRRQGTPQLRGKQEEMDEGSKSDENGDEESGSGSYSGDTAKHREGFIVAIKSNAVTFRSLPLRYATSTSLWPQVVCHIVHVLYLYPGTSLFSLIRDPSSVISSSILLGVTFVLEILWNGHTCYYLAVKFLN